MAIFALEKHTPKVESSVYVAESAQVIGKVTLKEHASIWPCAVLRGDLAEIVVGKGSNIQDNVCMHTEHDVPCIVEDDVTVGHGAILHSCTVKSGALIGMGAIVLNRAQIGQDAVVGAGALVAEGKIVEPRALVVGCPARFVRYLTDEEVVKNRANTAHYVKSAEIFEKSLAKIA